MSYTENKVVNLLIIFILILFVVLVSISFIKYQPYILVYGEVNNDYISFYLEDKEISNLTNQLKYNNEIYDYQIIEISSDYVIQENKLKRNVKINFDFDEDKYILECYLGIGKYTNVWENIYTKYMKGVI